MRKRDKRAYESSALDVPNLLNFAEEPPKLNGETLRTGEYEYVTQKLRVILHATPLIRLHFVDERRSENSRHYDALLLALKIFDLVVENAGLDTELDAEQMLDRLVPTLTRMDKAAQKTASREQHRLMVDYLLSRLRGDDTCVEEYSDLTADGVVRRSLPIKLLEGWFHPDGRVVLRLSPQALNLFLNALDLDIEDVQVAAEALVQSQLKRGKFQQAVESARQAYTASVQYKNKIDDVLRQTRRDISRVDWQHTVPEMLEDAVEHLAQRQKTEYAISDTAQDSLYQLTPGSIQAARVSSILALIEACTRRHTILRATLMGAREVFLNEQARQQFRPVSFAFPCFSTDILEPILEMPRGQAEAIFATPGLFAFLHTPRLLSWSELVKRHLRAPYEETAELIAEPDLAVAYDDSTRYSEALRQSVQKTLNDYLASTSGAACALSELLYQAQKSGQPAEALEYIALEAFRAFAPEDLQDDDKDEKTVWHTETTGEALAVAGFGGDDLLLK